MNIKKGGEVKELAAKVQIEGATKKAQVGGATKMADAVAVATKRRQRQLGHVELEVRARTGGGPYSWCCRG